MRRSGFKRPEPPQRTKSVPQRGTGRGAITAVDAEVRAVPKDAPVRSESYRRLVASLPCIECGEAGHSQAAHAEWGKGMAIKSSDLTCFPLCCTRPGVSGCHYAYGQGALYTQSARRAMEEMNATETKMQLRRIALVDPKVRKILQDVGLLP